jgi:hypothetical protein
VTCFFIEIQKKKDSLDWMEHMNRQEELERNGKPFLLILKPKTLAESPYPTTK